jgi:ligand-binding sensor domain-containing protein
VPHTAAGDSTRKIARVLPRKRALLAAAAAAIVVSLAAVLAVRFTRRVERVLGESGDAVRRERLRALAFVPVHAPAIAADLLGDGTVSAATVVRGALFTGGGSGLTDGERSWGTGDGLASLRIRALASWRGTLVFALERGGWGRLGSSLEEASSPWGRLEVRTFLEDDGGELLVGARQGLFRAAYAAGTLEWLDAEPVRALALGASGEILAGGERGLRMVNAGPVRRIATPDPWVESLGLDGNGRLWAATAVGIALGTPRGPLALHPRGGDGAGGVADDASWWFVPQGGEARVARISADGSRVEETTPEPFRTLVRANGALLGDGPTGLFRRSPSGRWTLERKRPAALPLPRVNALAADGAALWAGFFDGGIAVADDAASPGGPLFRSVSSDAWGVNALLPAGGAVWAATLQGTFRVEGTRATEVAGTGAGFALASTSSGVVIGTAQGALFPERRLLSAFHGLPGNQALALARVAGREALWVGTPSGLGRIDGRRVASRVVAGEGKLPHPWVTALAPRGTDLFVATYGGGVASRSGADGEERWTRYPETEGLKVNAIVALPGGRVAFGALGRGLFVSGAEARFARVDAALPSPDVFALALAPADAPRFLLAGTSEGLARISLGELK